MRLSNFDWKVERWHNGEGGEQELHEFLGLTWEEYAEFLRPKKPEQKTITFYDESYYTSNGCSCCEPTFWECWNTDNPLNGSCYSTADCYISAMHYFGYPIVAMTDNKCYDWGEDELESIACEWGIRVDFVYNKE